MDQLGSIVKFFESQTESKLTAGLPIIMRLDGKGFHKFTKSLDKPYDKALSQCMIETTLYLVKELQASFGYTQSDEITLIFDNEVSFHSEDCVSGSTMMFDGRLQKLCSIASAKCTAKFLSCLIKYLPNKVDSLPVFDNRVFQVPTKELAADTFYWRFLDCKKNAISMAASTVCSHTSLQKKNSAEKINMLAEKGIQFEDYPDSFKYGTMILVKKQMKTFTTEELANIPIQYQPTEPVLRTVIESKSMNVYSLYKQNLLTQLVFEKSFDINAKEK